MDLYKVNDIKKAKKIIRNEFFKIKKRTKEINTSKALGLQLAEDYFSKINLPSFNRSTVDGYAVISKNTFGANSSSGIPLNLKGITLVEEKNKFMLNENDAVEVSTGSMLPKNANGVIKIEYTERLNSKEILIFKSIYDYENMISIGEDIKKGKQIFCKGHFLRPQDIALLGSLGILKVKVKKHVSLGILSTGNEIININENISLGKVRDINSHLLINSLSCLKHIKCKYIGIVKDNIFDLKKIINYEIEKYDILLITGGSSVGKKDYILDIINSLGKILFHGLNIRPGKPTIAGNIKNKLILALPGNPLSCYFVFKKILAPFLQTSLIKEKYFIKGILSQNIKSKSGFFECIPVNFKDNIAFPVLGKSALINPLYKSNGYIEISKSKEGLKKGEKVKIFPFEIF